MQSDGELAAGKGVSALFGGKVKLRRVLRDIAVIGIDFAIVATTLNAALHVAHVRPFPPFSSNASFALSFAFVATAVFAVAGLYKRSWRYVVLISVVH